jgi:hypothetical protein
MGGTVLMTIGDARQSALHAKATASGAKRLRVGMAARVGLDSDVAEVLPATAQPVSTAGEAGQASKLAGALSLLRVVVPNLPRRAAARRVPSLQARSAPSGASGTPPRAETPAPEITVESRRSLRKYAGDRRGTRSGGVKAANHRSDAVRS